MGRTPKLSETDIIAGKAFSVDTSETLNQQENGMDEKDVRTFKTVANENYLKGERPLTESEYWELSRFREERISTLEKIQTALIFALMALFAFVIVLNFK